MCKTNDKTARFASICPAVQTERGTVDEAAFDAAISLLWGMENECDDIDERCDALENALNDRLCYLVDKAWDNVEEDSDADGFSVLDEKGERIMARARKVYRLMARAGMTIGEVEARILD